MWIAHKALQSLYNQNNTVPYRRPGNDQGEQISFQLVYDNSLLAVDCCAFLPLQWGMLKRQWCKVVSVVWQG